MIRLVKCLAHSILHGLASNHISTGTILLAANKISLDPTFVFEYNNQSGVIFPGPYDVIFIADHFGGGTINLSRFIGRFGKTGETGANGKEGNPENETPREAGEPGGPGGGVGGAENNIKILRSNW